MRRWQAVANKRTPINAKLFEPSFRAFEVVLGFVEFEVLKPYLHLNTTLSP